MHGSRFSLGFAAMAIAAMAFAPVVSATPRSGELHIVKDCVDYHGLGGQSCEITGSNLRAIPAGAHIVYASDLAFPVLDTDITITAGPGNVAHGHCRLDFTALPGACVLSGGTGKFTHIHASVVVSPLGGDLWAWDGTYAFGNGS